MFILRLQLRLAVTRALRARVEELDLLVRRGAVFEVMGVVISAAGFGDSRMCLQTDNTNVLHFIGHTFLRIKCQHHLYSTNELYMELSSTQ